jgi:hypothetical protein
MTAGLSDRPSLIQVVAAMMKGSTGIWNESVVARISVKRRSYLRRKYERGSGP